MRAIPLLALAGVALGYPAHWEFTTGGVVESSPDVDAQGTVYVGSADGTVRAFNPDGSLKWQSPGKGPIYGAIKVSPDGTALAFGSDS